MRPAKPGVRVWLGGLFHGVYAKCRKCSALFITTLGEPASVCLACDVKAMQA